MITVGPMTIPDEILAQAKAMAEQGRSHEELISYMRSIGLPKPHSISCLRRATGIPLSEATDAVHFSPTWDDRRASDDAFQEVAMQALEEWQREEPHPERLAS